MSNVIDHKELDEMDVKISFAPELDSETGEQTKRIVIRIDNTDFAGICFCINNVSFNDDNPEDPVMNFDYDIVAIPESLKDSDLNGNDNLNKIIAKVVYEIIVESVERLKEKNSDSFVEDL